MRCKRCVMTDGRLNLKFNEEGICNSCIQHDYLKTVDWSKRREELEALCDKYRNIYKNGGLEYDCIITVSGGKDSYFQVYLFKELLGMNPLCLMIDNTSWTETGRKNFYNMSEKFDVDVITFTPSVKKMKEETKKSFLKLCHPTPYWDKVLFRKPLEIAKALDISLVIWGEDTNIFVGSGDATETPNAKRLLEDPNEFPDLEVIFTSYYVPWNRFHNVEIAKLHGFQGFLESGEWIRRGFIGMFEDEQVDTIGYLMTQYTKFIKFGYGSMTEMCSKAIRAGKMTREEAIKIVNDKDWLFDELMLDDLLDYIGLTEKEFWKVIDKFANKKLLRKMSVLGWWRLKKDAI